MIVDAHVHVMSFPSYADLRNEIVTTADLIAFRSRYPELYARAEAEEPVDNSDDLIAVMDRHGVGHAVVQGRRARSPMSTSPRS